MRFPDELTRELADEIHLSKCRRNHTDGCGYFYLEWDKAEKAGPESSWIIKEYLHEKMRMYHAASEVMERFGRPAVQSFLYIQRAIREGTL